MRRMLQLSTINVVRCFQLGGWRVSINSTTICLPECWRTRMRATKFNSNTYVYVILNFRGNLLAYGYGYGYGWGWRYVLGSFWQLFIIFALDFVAAFVFAFESLSGCVRESETSSVSSLDSSRFDAPPPPVPVPCRRPTYEYTAVLYLPYLRLRTRTRPNFPLIRESVELNWKCSSVIVQDTSRVPT